MKYGFRIVNKKSDVLLATGYVLVVAADKQAGKAAQIPEEIVEKLEPFCK